MSETDASPHFEVFEEPKQHRFVLQRNGETVGFADYRPQGERIIVVPHVETMMQHRGQGYAGRLMDGLLAIIRRDGRSIIPQCPFAAGHIRHEPAHHDLLATG